MLKFYVLRSAVLALAIVGTAVATPALAQTPTSPPAAVPPPMPLGATPAQETSAISALNGLIMGYMPAPPLAGTAPLGGSLDANATSLLNQLKAKGIAVRMINLFISWGGTLNLSDRGNLTVGGAKVTAKYNVDAKTIVVGPVSTDKNHNLKTNLSVTVLSQIAHEFWHAYKSQIVDGGFDPDTAKVCNDLKTWLPMQKATFMMGDTPGMRTAFPDIIPGFFASTKATNTDDFADEYVAAILTKMFNFGPFLGGERTATRNYRYFGDFLADPVIGYFNDNGMNYRIDAPPPPELILHLERLVITNLSPQPAPVTGTVAGDGTGQQPQNPPADVAPEHSMFIPGNDGPPEYENAAAPRPPEQTINCFGDLACERALAQARGDTNLNFGERRNDRGDNRRDERRSPYGTPGVPQNGKPDFCSAGGSACVPIPGTGGFQPTPGQYGR